MARRRRARLERRGRAPDEVERRFLRLRRRVLFRALLMAITFGLAGACLLRVLLGSIEGFASLASIHIDSRRTIRELVSVCMRTTRIYGIDEPCFVIDDNPVGAELLVFDKP